MKIYELRPGTLHVFAGAVKGSKTQKIIDIFHQLDHTIKVTQLFKPVCDYRPELSSIYSRTHAVSRTGDKYPTTVVSEEDPINILAELDPRVDIVGIEETTLFEQPEKLVKVVLELMDKGKSVVCTGLDKNFRGEPFDPMPALLAHATSVEKCYGICDFRLCENFGEYSQRLINGEPDRYESPVKMVGAGQMYEARCLIHHKLPGKPISKLFPSKPTSRL